MANRLPHDFSGGSNRTKGGLPVRMGPAQEGKVKSRSLRKLRRSNGERISALEAARRAPAVDVQVVVAKQERNVSWWKFWAR